MSNDYSISHSLPGAQRLVIRLLLAAAATALLLTAECTCRLELSPEVSFHRIEQFFMSGKLAEAERECKQVEDALRGGKLLAGAWAVKFRLQHAKVHLYRGDSTEALSLLAQRIPENLKDLRLQTMRSALLATALDRTGDVAHAQRALLEAARTCPDDTSRASLFMSQGVIDGQSGRLAEAADAFRLSFASARHAGDRFQQAEALLNLGVAAERQEHYDEAIDHFTESSAIARQIGAGLTLSKAIGSAGGAFYKLGDYHRALENSQLAEQQAEQLGAPLDQVEWINNAGLSEFRLGDLRAAKTYYERSYQLARSLHDDGEIGNAQLALAYLSLETGDLSAALYQSRDVERLAARSGDPEDTLEPSLVEALALAGRGDTALAKAKLLTLEKQSASVLSVRWEAEHALARLTAAEGDFPEAERWFGRAIATYHQQRSSLNSIDERLPFFENGSSLYLDYVDELIHRGRTDDALTVLDRSRAETLAEGLQPVEHYGGQNGAHPLLNPQTLARRLGGTILVYCLRPGTSYLWAVGRRRTGFFRLPGREAILPLVSAHHQAILASKDVLNQPGSPGGLLFQALVAPAVSLLPLHPKVFLIADQYLSALNFESLPTPGDGSHFWIEDANIVNARSISLLAAHGVDRAATRNGRELLLVGDPLYTHPEQAQLPHAADEVARVARHFAPGQRLLLTGSAATPGAYQSSHPEQFAYIHFVAHASASESDPLDSSVILSGAPGQAETYKLYARNILDRRLSADLVTISGCYGSGVRSYSGEGLVGLAWAFLRTGSHHVIGALWEVSDASTPQLMGDLYDGLAHGEHPDTALRSAKLAMIHRGGIFRKPFYWAAFQLYAGA